MYGQGKYIADAAKAAAAHQAEVERLFHRAVASRSDPEQRLSKDEALSLALHHLAGHYAGKGEDGRSAVYGAISRARWAA